MRHEINFILSCVHKEMDISQRDQARSFLYPEFDWQFLLQNIQIHGILPLVYRTLKTNFADLVPPVFLAQLRAQYLKNLHYSLFLTAELLRLLSFFEANGIKAVPVKGPVLAATLYGHPGMRTFGDLDVLFQKKDVPRVKELLASQGYQLNLPLTEAQKGYLLRNEDEACLMREDGLVNVEVLWGTPGDFPVTLDYKPFWERTEKIPFEDRAILTLSPEDWVLYLSLHQANHGWNRLGWLTDLDQWIRNHPGMDWKELADRAKELHCRRVLFITLALMRKYLHTPLPQDIWQKVMADKIVQSMAQQRAANLLKEPQVPCSTYAQALFHLRATDRFRDKIHFCYRQAMTPTVVDWLAWPLPRPLFFLYYFFHPLRIAGNLFRRCLNRFYSSLPFLKAEIYPIQKSS